MSDETVWLSWWTPGDSQGGRGRGEEGESLRRTVRGCKIKKKLTLCKLLEFYWVPQVFVQFLSQILLCYLLQSSWE